jgi:hypothetical protein
VTGYINHQNKAREDSFKPRLLKYLATEGVSTRKLIIHSEAKKSLSELTERLLINRAATYSPAFLCSTIRPPAGGLTALFGINQKTKKPLRIN